MGYTVAALDASELPRRAPGVSASRRRRTGLPVTARPTSGLRVVRDGDARGFVYRFSSHGLAVAVAPAFLGHVWGKRGVHGCGRTIYLVTGKGVAADRLARDLGASLGKASGCSKSFAVIS